MTTLEETKIVADGAARLVDRGTDSEWLWVGRAIWTTPQDGQEDVDLANQEKGPNDFFLVKVTTARTVEKVGD